MTNKNIRDDGKNSFHVRVDKDLKRLLKMVAAKRNISMGLLVERAIAKYIEKDVELDK